MRKTLFIFILSLSLSSLNANGGKDESVPVSINLSPSLLYMEGVVMVNGLKAEEGQNIPLGASIQTGTNSYCEVLFAERNIVKIQEETITKLTIGPGQGKVELEKGAMAFLLEKLTVLGLGDSGFEVTTPLTTAGIRGTAFFIQVESPDSVYFCNCNGVIELSDIEGGNKQILESTQHKAVRYVKTDKIISQSQAPLLYHDDAEMDELASKINYKIPWGSADYNSGY